MGSITTVRLMILDAALQCIVCSRGYSAVRGYQTYWILWTGVGD